MKNPGLLDVKVGDTVTYRYGSYTPTEHEVLRVGPKYITIKKWGREVKFDRETGRAGINDGRIVTPAVLAHEARLDDVLLRLHPFGINPWGITPRVNDIETLEEIAEILERDGDDS